MEVRPGYKQTEVGVIPADWDIYRLGDILRSMQLGGNYRNSGRETSWPLVKMGNLGRGSIKLDKIAFIDLGHTPAHKDRLRRNDVLFNTRNTLDLVGKVALWRDELPEAYFNSNIMRMDFDGSLISSKPFMNYVLNTPHALKCLREIAIGTTSVAAIYGRDLVTMRVPLPPKPEQSAIAAALSDADAFIESLEHLLVKKRRIKQATLQELLSGRKRLPGFNRAWREAALGEMGKCHRGVSYNPDVDLYSFDTPATVRLLRSNNVQAARIVFDDMQFVSSGRVSPNQRMQHHDILICMANGSRDLVGKAGRFTTDDEYAYTFGAFMGGFRPNITVADPRFVFYLFQTCEYRAHIAILLAGSSINNLTPSSIEAFVARIPSHEAERTAIATILSDMDTEIASHQARLAKARQIKQGMMQELLTGRIRLI